MLLVILLFALFASLFTCSKYALDLASPYFLIGFRMSLAGCLLMGYQWVLAPPKVTPRQWLSLCLLGFCAIYVCNVSEIYGIQHMSSAKVCLLYSLSPFLSALLAYFCLKERLNPQKWLGLLFGFLGLIPIAFIQNSHIFQAHEWIHFSWPEAAVLVAVLSSVYGWILLKNILISSTLTPLFVNGVSMFIGGMAALAHSYLIGEPWHPLPVHAGQWEPFLQITLLMTLISNIICYNLYGFLLKKYSATFMSLAGLVTPLFASFFGWYFLNEHISWPFFVSVILFSIGLGLFYHSEKKNLLS